MRFQNKLGPLKNTWTLITVFSWLVAVGFIYWAARAYFYNIELQEQIHQMDQEIETMKRNLDNLEKTKHILSTGDEKLSAILANLTAASQESKVSLGEISIGEELPRESYRVLPITVQIMGTYNQIGNFINIIDRGDQRFQFWDLRLSTKDTKGKGIICKMSGEFIVL